MRIKRLEIYGFKSFPYRVVLPFPPGISAIVGPNGSGKSNIVDAFRWVLGEQSLKRLRVRAAEDLLFAGDHGRAPAFAEVRLVLENDGQAPESFRDLPEIVVARRLYRSGESEFLINNRACRLKDIHYLFLDTGVHPRGYGLIDQGEVGKFLEWSPEERRVFLEELAGVSRYRVNREESRRNLERTRENLSRVEDLLAELESRLQELSEQARMAREYRRLREEFRRLALTRLGLLYLRARRARDRAEKEIRELEEKLARLEEEEKGRLPEYEKTLAEVHLFKRKIRDLEEGLREEERRREEVSRKLRELYREEAELSRSLEREKTRKEALAEEIRRLEDQKKTLGEEKKSLSEALKAEEEGQEKARRELAALQEKLEKEEKTFREIETRLLSLKEKLRFAQNERERIRREIQGLSEKEKLVEQKTAQIVQEKEKWLTEKETLSGTVRALEAEHQSLLGELRARTTAQKETEAQLRALEEKLRALEQEKRGLLKEKEALSSALIRLLPPDLRRLRERKDLKLLADLLDLPPEARPRAEALLAERLTFPVAEGLEGLELLEKTEGLAGLFLSTPETRKRLESLLSRVEEARSPESLWENPPEVPVYLPDPGLLFEPPGFLKVLRQSGPGVLEIKSRLEEIASLMEELSSRISELSREREALREKLSGIQKEVKEAALRIQEREKEVQRARKRLAEAERALERLEQEEAFVRREEGELLRRRETLERDLAAKEEEAETLKREMEGLLSREAHLRQSLSALQEEVQRRDRELRERARKVAELSGRLKSLGAQEAELEKALSRARERRERAGQQEALLSEELNFVRETLRKTREERQKIEKTLENKRRELEALTRRYTELQEHLRQLEEEEKARSRERERLQERKHKLEIDRVEAEMTLAHLREEAREVHETDLEAFLSEGPPAERDLSRVEEALQRVRERLAQFPPVNLAAEEELQRVEERRNFLSERRAELLSAMADLEKAIERLDTESRRLLKEALAAANARLNEVFPLLFEGGRAELYLTRPEDPLASGLDLRVKLPGKPVKHLTMLSGGEKALCALAVLFAFYLVKPGPFCILDEVDAPLDEANTLRFNSLLQKLKERSQVILITHNPRVMEVADALFGVTMEEEGVSKVVSVKLV